MTIRGTGPASERVTVHGRDHRHGKYRLGRTHTGTGGNWKLSLPDGVLYNTKTWATCCGGDRSNAVHINVHQILRIDNRNGDCNYKTGRHCDITLASHDGKGFHYVLAGSSRSKVPGEKITVRRKGHVLGSGRMHKDGTFTIDFTTQKRTPSHLVLVGSGKDRDGVVWVLKGHRRFHIHD